MSNNENFEDISMCSRECSSKARILEAISSSLTTSEWSKEELAFLKTTESYCTVKGKLHAKKSHIYANKNKWLRFIVNFASAALGAGGCASFIQQVTDGVINPALLVFGVINLAAGIAGSIGEGFQWADKAKNHDLASDRLGSISTQIRRLQATPGLDRKDCELSIADIANQFSNAEGDAPFVDVPDDIITPSSRITPPV